MSYKKLEVWILANDLVREIHEMSLTLPKFEMYEEGSQIRKSSKMLSQRLRKGMEEKSIKLNI